MENPMYNVYLLPFKPARENWANELEKKYPDVHVMGCDLDHGTITLPESRLNEVIAFFAPDYQVELNTDGDILCDAIDFSL